MKRTFPILLFVLLAASTLRAQITSPAAVRYSNEWVRSSADRLARSYYLSKSLKNRWVSLGAGADALTVMRAELQNAAEFISVDVHQHIHRGGLIWQAFEAQTGAGPIPNTVDTIVDGSPEPNKASITGVQANAVFTRMQEFLRWGDTGLFVAAPAGGTGGLTLYSIMDPAIRAPNLARATTLITRFDELIADYEAGGNTKLNSILLAAVNTGQ